MKTIHDIRRSNARKLRDGVGGNSSFATMIDREPTQTSRFMGDGATKNIGDSMAR
ncbi:LexA family transcriptional repressor, partial [Salmonella enterica subsp. enterica serovar Typhimurium]|nr:LexA family transcriptional repressor [Salmonella enterica subsp. enterica]EBF6671810.1 LexA family transcriptional repressor [Salmonella enterica subsp. enterica serovar Typhimurium]EBH5675356.1 LexA family transcriptional repressor [Salmonella enterica]EBH8304697.1 LexA family transcriptional repressor [Salmonella enterica subsp. enterica serovar Typhimurium str. UK-1]EDX5216882.1 LexA family transcriptional repressor [Salmonella enterica subsp. enterica serovar 4,[5],12:i:-]EDZ8787045.1 